MENEKNKPKSPSVWERLIGKPQGPAKAEAKPKTKDNRPSIAEYINFGGQFRDPKKDYERNK